MAVVEANLTIELGGVSRRKQRIKNAIFGVEPQKEAAIGRNSALYIQNKLQSLRKNEKNEPKLRHKTVQKSRNLINVAKNGILL